MAINFPNSPSVNDTHTVGSITYQWDGISWNSVISGGALTIAGEQTVTGILSGTVSQFDTVYAEYIDAVPGGPAVGYYYG